MQVIFQGKIKDVKSAVSEAGDGKTTICLISEFINETTSAYLYALQKLPQNASRELYIKISDQEELNGV